MASDQSTSQPALEPYFDDPRLHMTIPGRFLVRVASNIAYLFLTVLTLTLLISQLPALRWWGILLGIFLLDRFFIRHEADRILEELPSSGKVNLAAVLHPKAFSVLERSWDKSILTGSNFYLEATRQLLSMPEVRQCLQRLDLDIKEFTQKLDEFVAKSVEAAKEEKKIAFEDRSMQAQALVLASLPFAVQARHQSLEPGDMFCALAALSEDWTKRLFGLFSLDAQDVSRALIFSYQMRRSVFSRSGGRLLTPRTLKHRVVNRAWTSRVTPTLDSYSSDFTDLARRGLIGFMVGHQAEYDRLIDTISRPLSPNALLIGEEGSGRNTLVMHLAYDVVHDKVPSALFDKRVVVLEINALVAGAAGEELASRITRIAQEIVIAGNVILYIPDMHNMAKSANSAYLSAADALMPIIKSDAFPIIGATYPREFKEFLEPRSDIIGAFEVIRVAEISEGEAQELLVYEALGLEEEFKITISFGAIKKAVMIAKKYFHNKLLPSSAADLLKETLVAAKRKQENVIGVVQIVKIAEEKVNIPIHETQAEEAEALLHLEDIIHKQFIDQEEAVKGVAQALREYRSGLSRPGGPIASFLFVGPTGVGKTELAKILARLQFGSEQLMVRFDMSEYQDKQSFFRLIGSPDRKVSGALTDAVLEKPYCLVLLDEFEKAYPDILNLFLQVLDDGRLTDNLGRVVDFQNTIIIATSNAHSDLINQALQQGDNMTSIAEYLKKRLSDVFKPELLNRFSKIIIFKSFKPEHLIPIAALNLQELAHSLAVQGISLQFDPAAVEKIAKLGFDPLFGARPLRQVIEEKVRSPLAEQILKKQIGKGSRITLTIQGEEFQFVAS